MRKCQLAIHRLIAEVDFSKPIEFLQQELFKEIIDERKGRKMADQIAKVQLKSGEEQWVLVHTEVQTQDAKDFPQRMFQYYYRIFDRYNQKIVAVALFTMASKISKNRYNYLYFGTELSYTFNKYIISDFDEEELKNSPKLFSKALLASIYMNRSSKKMSERSAYKRALLRKVWSLENIKRKEMSALLYFIDYLLKLPKDMSKQLQQEMRAEIRKEDEEMLELYKEDLPPTLAGILELERQEGIDLGIKRGIKQVAKNMLVKGISIEDIMDATSLSLEEIEALRALD